MIRCNNSWSRRCRSSYGCVCVYSPPLSPPLPYFWSSFYGHLCMAAALVASFMRKLVIKHTDSVYRCDPDASGMPRCAAFRLATRLWLVHCWSVCWIAFLTARLLACLVVAMYFVYFRFFARKVHCNRLTFAAFLGRLFNSSISIELLCLAPLGYSQLNSSRIGNIHSWQLCWRAAVVGSQLCGASKR